MESCREFEAAIDRELAEGLAPAERELLLDHLEGCEACSELFDLLTALRHEPALAEPSEHELARLRQRVLAALPASRPRPVVGVGLAWRWALAAGLALALLGGGVLLGRRSAGPPPDRGELAAGGTLSPTDLRRAGYRFAGAVVEERGGDRLRLSFDVARSVAVEVDRDDPLVTEVLVQSLASRADLGTRLRAVETAARRFDPRVRQAFLEVMRHDENVGVRMAAQEKLLALEADPELVEALLQVLAEEESVQMRLAAIDYLTANQVDAGRLTRAIEAGAPAGEQALFVHASSYLTDRAAARP